MKKIPILCNTLFDEWISPNDFIEYIKIIKYFKKNHGNIIFEEEVLAALKKDFEELYIILKLLKEYKQIDNNSLNYSMIYAHNHKKYQSTVFIWSSSKDKINDIKTKVQKLSSSVDILEKDLDYVWVEVFGDIEDFKKDIIQDATKLLA